MKRSKASKKTANKQRSNKTTKVETEKYKGKSLCKMFINWKTMLVGAMIFLGSIGGFFTDFFSPVKEWVMDKIDPPTYWECSQDKNIRGIVMSDVFTRDRRELYLLHGMQGKQSWKVNKLDDIDRGGTCAVIIGRLDSCLVKYKINKKHKLLLSMDLYDASNCLVCKVVDNEFILNHNCEFTWNSDDWGFEIVDSDFNVVFSVNFYPPDALAVQGMFYTGGQLVVVNDDGLKTIPKENLEEIRQAKKDYQSNV